MLRRHVIAAWRRPCVNSLSHWERIELRLLSKGSREKFERHRGRCQKEKKKEGAVKANKSKTKPVRSWRCQHQARAMKALQRVVWSLIFLVFEVHLVNAEEQENQAHQGIAKKAYPTPQPDLRWEKMHCYENDEKWERIWELRGCCLEQKEKRNSQGRDPNTLERNSQERTREPLKKKRRM